MREEARPWPTRPQCGDEAESWPTFGMAGAVSALGCLQSANGTRHEWGNKGASLTATWCRCGCRYRVAAVAPNCGASRVTDLLRARG